MQKFLVRGLLVSFLAAATWSCGNSTSSLTGSTTTPTTPLTTETFNGTLTTNGAVTFHFAAGGAGSVSAQLTTFTPSDLTITASLVLGTWNGTTCQTILSNDAALQGSSVLGNVSAASNLCVRIADANGTIPGPTPFVISVSHP